MYLAVAIGVVQCPVGNAAVATVWTATKVHGELHEFGQQTEKQPQQDFGGDSQPSVDVQTRGEYANTGHNLSSWHFKPQKGLVLLCVSQWRTKNQLQGSSVRPLLHDFVITVFLSTIFLTRLRVV